jgi:hypothetical protein
MELSYPLRCFYQTEERFGSPMTDLSCTNPDGAIGHISRNCKNVFHIINGCSDFLQRSRYFGVAGGQQLHLSLKQLTYDCLPIRIALSISKAFFLKYLF